MSNEATPGYPAPLTACIVVTNNDSTPNLSCNGANATTSPIAEQFGLVTIYPPDFLRQHCCSISARWSGLTSGITSGTSCCIRNADELLTTAHPASANLGSSSRAIPASSAAKITRGAPAGPASETGSLRTGSGIGVFSRQRTASSYFLPSERSEAASHATSNHGCPSNNWIKRCPTTPV